MTKRFLNSVSTYFVASILASLPMGAKAVDGVVLIDQSRALAGGVTPGDAPGFPISISQPGSYRLAGNLTVLDADTAAIEISASNVTLDLNGFTISGPHQCNLNPGVTSVVCSLNGQGRGVRTTGLNSAITVANGTIRGMGIAIDMVSAGGGNRVHDIAAIGNRFGIFVGSALVSRNIVTINQGAGISAGGASLLIDNSVSFNGGVGLLMSTNTASIGYARNLVTTNFGGNISGGVNLGGNACDANLLCP